MKHIKDLPVPMPGGFTLTVSGYYEPAQKGGLETEPLEESFELHAYRLEGGSRSSASAKFMYSDWVFYKSAMQRDAEVAQASLKALRDGK